MARPKSQAHVVSKSRYKRDPNADQLPPALAEVIDEGDEELFRLVATAGARARFAGEDTTDHSVMTLIVASCRAELAERRAGGTDPFAA